MSQKKKQKTKKKRQRTKRHVRLNRKVQLSGVNGQKAVISRICEIRGYFTELLDGALDRFIDSCSKESKEKLVFYMFHSFSGKIPRDKSTESARYIAFYHS